MVIRNIQTGLPIRTISEFDAQVASLVPEPDTGLLVEKPQVLSSTQLLANRAFEMATRAREYEAEGKGHFALKSEMVIVPVDEDDGTQQLPDGSGLRDSVQNDLGGGLWTYEINGQFQKDERVS
jgi:hypothetical protein